MGLIFTGVLKQTHTYLLLESDLCYKMFSNLYRIYTTVDPGECFASERVMLVHINKLSFTSFAIREKIGNSNEEWNSRSQKIKVISNLIMAHNLWEKDITNMKCLKIFEKNLRHKLFRLKSL